MFFSEEQNQKTFAGDAIPDLRETFPQSHRQNVLARIFRKNIRPSQIIDFCCFSCRHDHLPPGSRLPRRRRPVINSFANPALCATDGCTSKKFATFQGAIPAPPSPGQSTWRQRTPSQRIKLRQVAQPPRRDNPQKPTLWTKARARRPACADQALLNPNV
jgi:hypothetical protein